MARKKTLIVRCVTKGRNWSIECAGSDSALKSALAGADDLQGLAEYWDTYYNGNPTKGFPEEAVRNYRRFVLEERGL